MYEEYFEKKSSEMPINFATQQVHNHEDSPSTSSIYIKKHVAPPIITTSGEQAYPISLNEADEFYQQDSAELDGKMLLTSYDALDFSEAESSTALDPSNMHELLRPCLQVEKRIIWSQTSSTSMDSGFKLIAYSDADRAGCTDDYKSTSGGIQLLGKKLRSRSSKKQDCSAMSTTKAKYVSLSACCAQVIWMRTQLLDYGHKYNKIPMYCDSKSAIAISYNPVQHSRTKHINIWYHFIKEHVEKGTIKLYFDGIEYQFADLFTKALSKECFEYLVHRIGQFWHTLQEDGSKYRLKFVLDQKDITMTLNDFRRTFHLPQATDNNHKRFVVAPKFSEMIPFFLNTLDYANVILFVNNIHVAYIELLWEGLHYALKNPSTQIPYPIFTKLIIGHYMTAFPEISRKTRDKYHNLEDDVMVKNIFNSGKHKDGVGMKIPSWMITDEMKLMDHYRMTTSAPRSHNPDVDEEGSSAPQKSSKSRDELKAKQNVQKVKEHLIVEEIEKLVEGLKNVETAEVDSSTLRQNDNLIDLGTRLEPRSDKESPEEEITDRC
uniref:Retrovirus-related Pol polyprotein from transposon TNT 1-94 n=1 Tax=Tanacetum cinerariifolium TaxID=118510 RepID=A0A699H5U2_TANCI|nr:retrovirus-related Pol polyprotein from transposon TNT 1-94 [Tanacetum cinerariifolium]